MEVVKNIAAIIGCILSAISLIMLCSKAGRAAIKRFFSRNTKDLHEENAQQTKDIEEMSKTLNGIKQSIDALTEVSKQQCRDTIKNIYYKYYREEKIPLYERKTADRTMDIYKKIYKENKYADLLYDEIKKWKIDKDYPKLEEEE